MPFWASDKPPKRQLNATVVTDVVTLAFKCILMDVVFLFSKYFLRVPFTKEPFALVSMCVALYDIKMFLLV